MSAILPVSYIEAVFRPPSEVRAASCVRRIGAIRARRRAREAERRAIPERAALRGRVTRRA